MAIISLEELKAENAAEEDEVTPAPQVDETETEDAAAELETDKEGEAAEPDPDKPDDDEADDWKQPDGHTSEKLFTSQDIRAARLKAVDKGGRQRDGEVEELRREISELKGRSAKPDTLGRPKRAQFYEAEDPDTAYEDAVLDWMKGTVQAESTASNASAELNRKQANAFDERNEAVDAHYNRAAELAKESGISAELYQKSDMKVRKMVEGLYPGAGDTIVDELIKQVGEGSERVMFSLGIKHDRLNELRTRLMSDPNGLSAAVYLGKLNEQSKPRKRKSTAPAPADQIDGDVQSVSGKASKKEYDALHKSGEIGKAFTVKMEAKKAGVDITQW